MPETAESRSSVQDSLQRVTELLHKHELVESLVHRQEGPRQELVETLVHKHARGRAAEAARRAASRRTSPTSSRRCRSSSGWSSGISSRPSATARSCSKSPTRCARRSSRTWTSRSWSPRPSSSTPTRSPTSRRTCRDEVIQDVFQSLPVEEREQLRAAMSYPEDTVGALMDFDMITHPRRRHARGRPALPAPARRDAGPHRPAVRGRPRRAA